MGVAQRGLSQPAPTGEQSLQHKRLRPQPFPDTSQLAPEVRLPSRQCPSMHKHDGGEPQNAPHVTVGGTGSVLARQTPQQPALTLNTQSASLAHRPPPAAPPRPPPTPPVAPPCPAVPAAPSGPADASPLAPPPAPPDPVFPPAPAHRRVTGRARRIASSREQNDPTQKNRGAMRAGHHLVSHATLEVVQNLPDVFPDMPVWQSGVGSGTRCCRRTSSCTPRTCGRDWSS